MPNFAALSAALAARERARINAILSDWLASRVDVGDRWNVFAQVLQRNGEGRKAVEAMRRYAGARPVQQSRLFDLAVLLAENGHGDEALTIVDRLTGPTPTKAQLHHFAGTLRSERGDFAAAETEFLTALMTQSHSGQTWLELASIHRFSPDDELLVRLEAVGPSIRATAPVNRGPYFYALGKAYDDAGRADQAFEAFATGARFVAAERLFDAAADRRFAADLIKSFTSETIRSRQARGVIANSQPIFVTGLPRSGTTLIEQIIASHSAVAGGGELNRFGIVVEEIGGGTLEDLDRYIAKGGSVHALGQLYLDLIQDQFGNAGRVVDKTLNASRLMGLIATILPKAPIIWVRRDPLDTAWSCFRTYFAQGVPWSWQLKDIADYFIVEDQLFKHWTTTLGNRILVVPYEEITTAPEPWIARILDHCGLPYEAATTKPHLTQRRVLTSSVAQVRAPINTNAAGAGERYRRHLQSFSDAYDWSGYTG